MGRIADGGIMASKPYAASGKCLYDPAESVGEKACPFTTLYWDFLMRNEMKLTKLGRMDMQLRNLVRIEPAKKAAITKRANEWKECYR